MYYRHVPLRNSDEFGNVYVLEEGRMQEEGEEGTGAEQYYQEGVSEFRE